MKNEYKIIFLDIDGTLVDDEKVIPAKNIEVIYKLIKKGILVVLTSGRAYKSIEKFSNNINAKPYIIASNGAIAVNYEKNINIFSNDIKKDIALEILQYIEEKNLYANVTINGNVIVEKELYGYEKKFREEVLVQDSIKKYIIESNDPILKITVLNYDKNELEIIRNKIIEKYGISAIRIGKLKIPQIYKNVEYEDPYILDIMANEVNKGMAIKKLCEYLNIKLDETVAFGDGENDIEMLETVKIGVAMENGVESLKNVADFITKKNTNAGVSYGLEKIFFKE